jgi:selenocysteine lyase/cysteine desulfurase
MLSSQRALFDIPLDVCYLNAASYSPLPLRTLEAGRAAVARKGRPWLIDNAFAAQQYDRVRKAAAALINAAPEDVALISSVGYGVSTAAKVFAVPPGSRVLVLQDDHSSAVLEWVTRAEEGGFTVETVRRPQDGDWTAAVLTAIGRPGAAPIAIASISSVHWSDGGVVNLGRVAPALRERGAALLVDVTHSAGVLDLDVQKLDPDFLVFPTYSGSSALTRARSFTSPSATRTAFPWSRRATAGAPCGPSRISTSPIRVMSATRGASTWASAIISSPWKWRPSAWR